MSLNDLEATQRIFSAVARTFRGVSVLLLFLAPESTTTLAWTHRSTKPNPTHSIAIAMRSGGALFRDGGRPTSFGPGRRPTPAIMAPNRASSSGLYLSTPQQQQQPSSQSSINDSNSDNESESKLDESHLIFDASLVGDYLVRMSSSSDEDFVWQLYSIRDVVAASVAESKSGCGKDEETIWTDGTEATEALSYGLSVKAETFSSSHLTPRAEVLCVPSTDRQSFDSQTRSNDPGKPCDEKALLSLLQILQTQWVAGLQQQQPPQAGTTNDGDQAEDSRWTISAAGVSSQEGISRLFQEAGLLEGNADNVEWVEMITGSSRIVGRLPRSLVHKFNILHRGIGAFITKDRPIDLPVSSSIASMPDLYVHRRAADKRIFPSLYDMFVGGVSLAGEDSELTAQREIAEELGLAKALSTALGTPFLTCLICTAYNRCLVDLFQYAVDETETETIRWQEEEVAWGDFVDYRVVTASADLSMQRAASERKWPGPYPPIQSQLKGMIPEDGNEDDSSGIVEYDGNWKEWDYVPDGLLVWKAWLEMIETERSNSCPRPATEIESPALSFEVEFRDEEGTPEMVAVELASMKDVIPISQKLAARFNADINDIQSMLKQMWADATEVPLYDGPSLAIESIEARSNAECAIELPSGLVFELRPSTIGEDAGLGLFVRKASSDIDDVLQTQGSAFCGYGPCDQITDNLAGLSRYQRQRSFEFILSDGLDSYVWHEGNLLTIGDVLQSTGAKSVKAHSLVETPEGGVFLVHNPKGKPCYLIPPAERPDPKSLTIQTIGHMCNDLAGGIKGNIEKEYDTSSYSNNLLVLVPRVAANDDGVLQPTGMPILTLAKSVYIGNVVDSMEVGLRYGDSYWKNEFP